MIKFLVSFCILQIGISFGAAAAAASAGPGVAISPDLGAAVAAAADADSVGPVEHTKSPLEQCALRVLNSAHALFEGKKFSEMDVVRKAQFTEEFLAAFKEDAASKEGPIACFSVFEGLMRDGFIDGFDRALICLQHAKSSLAQYMAPFCILARVQEKNASYRIPECVMSYVLDKFSGNKPEDFRQHLPKTVLYEVLEGLTLAALQADKQFARTLSPYFAYVMNVRSHQFSSMAIQYAACLGNKQINHQANGEVFADILTAEKFATYVYYKQIDLYKKLANEEHFKVALKNFSLVFDTKKITVNPETKRNFSSDADYYNFLKSFLGNWIYRCPKFVIHLESDPKKKIEFLCATLDTLESDDLIFLALKVESDNHPSIMEQAAKLFKKSNPCILEQKAFLFKKAYEQKNPEFSNQALIQLCVNCLLRDDAKLLPGYNGNNMLTIIYILTSIVEKSQADSDVFSALWVLRELRDIFGYELNEDLNNLITAKIDTENPQYHNLFRMIDAKVLLENPYYFNVTYLEQLLKPVIEDQDFGTKACQMLYDFSLKVSNMQKAFEYADNLHQKTTHKVKSDWSEIMKVLQRYLNPSTPSVQDEVSPEAKERAAQLLAKQEEQEKAERQAWIQKQLELRELYKNQHPEEEVKSPFNFDRMSRLRCDIKEDTRVAEDLRNYEDLKALRTKYDETQRTLEEGRHPSDTTKYRGVSVKVSGEQYPLWHCRLNDVHRVFYYKIGTDVYVIQAFGHDLNEARLPR